MKKAISIHERSEDPKVQEAKLVLRRHFVVARNRPSKTPYYLHQLQVLYEGDFFRLDH